MELLTWLILGLIAGFLANLIDPSPNPGGWIGSLVLGVLGALVGGYLGNLIFGVGVTGFNLTSIIVATVGAMIVLFIYKTVAKRA